MTTLNEETEGGDDSSEMMGDLLGEFSGEGFESSGFGEFGSGSGMGDVGSGEDEGGEEEGEDPFEYVEVSKWWVAPLMRFMSIVHSIISLAMLVAYYHLKVRGKLKKKTRRRALVITFWLKRPRCRWPSSRGRRK